MELINRLVFACLLLLVVCFSQSNASKADEVSSLVFVSVAKDQKIACFAWDDSQQKLTLNSEASVLGGPGAMCIDRNGKHIYIVKKKTGSIAVFEISPDASLKPIGETAIGEAGSYLAIHPTGKFLFSAYYQAGQVAVHAIDSDGKLSAKPLQVLQTDERAHCIAIDPSGRFAFVPHTRPNTIFQFLIDQETGLLTPNETPKVLRESGGPRHLWFHPNKEFVYGSDEKGSSITCYRLDKEAGTLEVVETVSSLPTEGFDGKNSTSDIEVHPSGKFVFIANRGHDSIASFQIDQQTGRLSNPHHAITEATTRSFNISPNGKTLISAGQKSGRLAVFRIDETGALERTETRDVGAAPWWVQIVGQ